MNGLVTQSRITHQRVTLARFLANDDALRVDQRGGSAIDRDYCAQARCSHCGSEVVFLPLRGERGRYVGLMVCKRLDCSAAEEL